MRKHTPKCTPNCLYYYIYKSAASIYKSAAPPRPVPLGLTVGAPTAKLAVGLTVGAHSGDSQWGLTVGAPTAKLAVGLTVGAPTAKKLRLY